MFETTDYEETTENPDDRVTTIFEGELSHNSDKFPGQSKYFQAIRVLADKTGYHEFRCISDMDSYGFFYRGDFLPENPNVNLILSNDDSYRRDFGFSAHLTRGVQYTLVATSYSTDVSGRFSIVVKGPETVELSSIKMTANVTGMHRIALALVLCIFIRISRFRCRLELLRDNTNGMKLFKLLPIPVNITTPRFLPIWRCTVFFITV